MDPAPTHATEAALLAGPLADPPPGSVAEYARQAIEAHHLLDQSTGQPWEVTGAGGVGTGRRIPLDVRLSALLADLAQLPLLQQQLAGHHQQAAALLDWCDALDADPHSALSEPAALALDAILGTLRAWKDVEVLRQAWSLQQPRGGVR